MGMRLSHVALWVRDQDQALRWYTEKLGFEKRQDIPSATPGFRWLTVAPPGQAEPGVALVKPDPRIMGEAAARDALQRVGGNPTWVLTTDDCRRAHGDLSSRGGEVHPAPWGISAAFVDLYGNPYNLLEPRRARPGTARGGPGN